MAPLSKRKSYTDLITSMGAGDSEPDEERIMTTLVRHMAKVGVLKSGLTKHMNQVRLKYTISEDITSYPECLRTYFNSNKAKCLLNLLSLAVLKKAALKEKYRERTGVQHHQAAFRLQQNLCLLRFDARGKSGIFILTFPRSQGGSRCTWKTNVRETNYNGAQGTPTILVWDTTNFYTK
ncbi:hypothetical protein BDV34DRAFT_225857 [Aspergillus parasiticus]|uniref:Uncharacterized protein n=1 Tax=Aspergillus parasiticus TaxID=5067 RepID=A0A5N6DIW7_ASPPA|nr:hypothetical protein BDV34DRAFT_225857 [Aspergillus parasiticus]